MRRFFFEPLCLAFGRYRAFAETDFCQRQAFNLELLGFFDNL